MTESAIHYFLRGWLDPLLVVLTAAANLAGIYIGAIPGLSVTMAVSILISFTFAWEVNSALALMVGVHFVIAMIGLFGVAEALIQIHQINVKPIKQDVSKIVPSLAVIWMLVSQTPLWTMAKNALRRKKSLSGGGQDHE
jgi:TctA family transporter